MSTCKLPYVEEAFSNKEQNLKDTAVSAHKFLFDELTSIKVEGKLAIITYDGKGYIRNQKLEKPYEENGKKFETFYDVVYEKIKQKNIELFEKNQLTAGQFVDSNGQKFQLLPVSIIHDKERDSNFLAINILPLFQKNRFADYDADGKVLENHINDLIFESGDGFFEKFTETLSQDNTYMDKLNTDQVQQEEVLTEKLAKTLGSFRDIYYRKLSPTAQKNFDVLQDALNEKDVSLRLIHIVENAYRYYLRSLEAMEKIEALHKSGNKIDASVKEEMRESLRNAITFLSLYNDLKIQDREIFEIFRKHKGETPVTAQVKVVNALYKANVDFALSEIDELIEWVGKQFETPMNFKAFELQLANKLKDLQKQNVLSEAQYVSILKEINKKDLLGKIDSIKKKKDTINAKFQSLSRDLLIDLLMPDIEADNQKIQSQIDELQENQDRTGIDRQDDIEKLKASLLTDAKVKLMLSEVEGPLSFLDAYLEAPSKFQDSLAALTVKKIKDAYFKSHMEAVKDEARVFAAMEKMFGDRRFIYDDDTLNKVVNDTFTRVITIRELQWEDYGRRIKKLDDQGNPVFKERQARVWITEFKEYEIFKHVNDLYSKLDNDIIELRKSIQKMNEIRLQRGEELIDEEKAIEKLTVQSLVEIRSQMQIKGVPRFDEDGKPIGDIIQAQMFMKEHLRKQMQITLQKNADGTYDKASAQEGLRNFLLWLDVNYSPVVSNIAFQTQSPSRNYGLSSSEVLKYMKEEFKSLGIPWNDNIANEIPEYMQTLVVGKERGENLEYFFHPRMSNMELADDIKEKYRDPSFKNFTKQKEYEAYSILFDLYNAANERLNKHDRLRFNEVPQVPKKLESGIFSIVKTRTKTNDGEDDSEEIKTVWGKVREFWKRVSSKYINEAEEVVENEDGSKVRIDNTRTDVAGDEHRRVPVKYTSSVDIENLSENLIQNVLMFNSMSHTSEKLNEIELEMSILKMYLTGNETFDIDERKIIDKKGNLVAVDKYLRERMIKINKRNNSRLIETINSLMYDVGEHKNDWYFKSLFGNDYLKVDGNKLIKSLAMLTSVHNIGFNIGSAIGNLQLGQLNNLIEASGGKYFNSKQLAQARMEVGFGDALLKDFGQMSDNPKRTLLNQQVLFFDAIQGEAMDIENRLKFQKMKERLFSMDKLFLLQHLGEYVIQATSMKAFMKNYKIKLNDGKTITMDDVFVLEDNQMVIKPEYYDKLTEAEWETQFTNFKNTLHGINKELQGNYNNLDKTGAQFYAVGSAMLQFRKHLYQGFKTRFSGIHYDREIGSLREGYYKTFMKISVLKFQGQYEFWNDLVLNKNGKLTENELYNLRKFTTEMSMFVGLAALALFMAHYEDDDEDLKKSFMYSFAQLQVTRLGEDVGTYLKWYSTAERTVNTPMVMVKVLGKYVKLLLSLGTFWNWGDEYDRASGFAEKGDNKLAVQILKTVPISRQIVNLMSPEDILAYYNLTGN